MMQHWYDDGYLVAFPVLLVWSLLLAAVGLYRPAWLDACYRPVGIRITPKRGRIIGYILIVYAVCDAVAWLVYVS